MKYIGLFLIAPFISMFLARQLTTDEATTDTLIKFTFIIFLFVIGCGLILI